MLDIRFDGKLDYLIDNIGFVNVSRDKDFTFPYKTGKERHSLIFVENGEINYYFTQNQKSINAIKGSVLFIPKHTPYIATYTQNNTVIKILTFDIVSNELPSIFNSPIIKKEAIFSSIYNTLSGKKTNSTTFLASKIYELLYTIEKESAVTPNKYKKIIPALNEIQNFYFQNKKLSYYSDLCGMSESNFRKLFKEYIGKSPVEYRNLIRISQASKMIDTGEYTVGEAAYLAGFNNMSFFYEVYKKYMH